MIYTAFGLTLRELGFVGDLTKRGGLILTLIASLSLTGGSASSTMKLGESANLSFFALFPSHGLHESGKARIFHAQEEKRR